MMMSTQSTSCEYPSASITTSNIETTNESTHDLTSITQIFSSLSTSNTTSSSKEEEEDEKETNAITPYKKEESSSKKQQEKQRKKEEGRRRAIEISKQRNNSTNKNTKKNSINARHGARNQHRHKHFLRWILQTFPDAIQSAQAPPSPPQQGPAQQTQPSPKSQKRSRHRVLDVAGGKGELSSRLALCHNTQVTLIDPRPANLPRVYRTIVHKSLPQKWQQRLADRTAANPNFVEWEVERKWNQLVMHFGEGRVEDCPELKRAVEECVLLIGLHADGATEAIVNVAKRFRKPFVVVPCCVFPNLFTERRVRVEVSDSDNDDDDGGGVTVVKSVPVRNHEQFCQYLLQMDSHFRGEILPFEGRNFGIWWDGKCLDSDDDS